MLNSKLFISLFRLFITFALGTTSIFATYKCAVTKQNIEKSIWIHTGDSDDVLAIEGLFIEIKTHYPDLNCYISTVTLEAKLVAEYLTARNFVKVIPHDDIDTMAYHFQRIKPKVIIIVRHQISPTLVLLAHLYKVPIFLIDAHLSQRTERLLSTSNDFYWRILKSFDQILVEEEADKKAFQNIDIDSDKISTVGPLRACNILHRKKMLLDYFEISEKELNKKFSYPILLAHSLSQKTLELYLATFSSLKKKFPDLKMILSPGCTLSWKKDLIHLAQTAHHSLYTWDFNNVNGVIESEKSDSKMFIQKLEKIFTSNDIILSCIDGSLFFWNAFANIFLTDETTGFQGNDNFFEATAWKTPIILGPQNSFKIAHIKSELLEKKILINVENKEQLITQITELFLKENLRILKGEEGYIWLKKISRDCDNGFKPFFEKLKNIINK